MKCEYLDNCGFIKWVKNFRPKINLPTNECPKNEDCIRLNPISRVSITYPKLVSREEIEIANPILYTDEKGNPRRV